MRGVSTRKYHGSFQKTSRANEELVSMSVSPAEGTTSIELTLWDAAYPLVIDENTRSKILMSLGRADAGTLGCGGVIAL